MNCPCDNTKRNMPGCDAGTPPVLEVSCGEVPVLFHTVNIPASVGDVTTLPPTPGAYRNTRVTYEANNSSYLYDSDGIPQLLATSEVAVNSVNGQTGDVVLTAADIGAQEKLTAGTSITISPQNVISAPAVDTVLDKTSSNPISNSAVATAIETINTELDRTVVYDLEMTSDADSVTFTEDKIDVVTGVTSQETDIIPTASSTTAGTITAAEFRSLTASQERLDALENGSVAVANLPASPTQSELTTAWLNATDQEELINRASIFDITNSKVWTYYTNILLWEETPAGAITVNPFTNSTAGTILGSATDGSVSANLDGTGSVYGWADLKQTVSEKANSSDLATVATTGAYSDLSGTPSLATVATSGDYDDLLDKPTIGDATLTIQKNGTDVQTFTANATSNVTANITVPTSFADLTGQISTAQIADKAVTSAKITDEAITTGSVSGTGTDITLANTPAGADIESIQLDGNTTQQTYTGKNLANGVFVKYAIGGNSGTTWFTNNNSRSIKIKCEPSTTYTVTKFTSSNRFAICDYPSDPAAETVLNGLYNNQSVTIGSATVTTHSDAQYLFVYVSNDTTEPQLQIEKGSQPTSYEPYVGGIASPNPSYPQNVNVVTGLQTVNVHSKNLFDKNNASYMGGYFEIGGTISTSSSSRNRVLWIPCEANTTYSLTKATGTWSGGSWILGVCHETPAAGVSVYNAVSVGNNTTYNNYTTDSSSTYLVLRCQNADSTTYAWDAQVGNTGLTVWQTVLAGLQIEKNSTATAYVPYGSVTKTINLGKNLNGGYPSNYSSSSSSIDYVNNADGTISVDAGTATNNSNSVTSSAASSQGRLLRLSAGTYTVSGSTSNIRIGVADSAGTQLATSANGNPDTFTINTETLAFVRAQVPNGTTVSATTLYPQLEKGSTATDYAAYFTPIELCKIGTYQDYIYKSGDDWYVHKATTNFTIDGNSGGYYSGSNWYYVSFSNLGITKVGDSSTLQMYSMYFEPYAYNTLSGDNTINGAAQSSTNFVIRNTNYTDATGYQTWLASALPKFYYPLATPTDTKITNATLISELEGLLSVTTYADNTYISVTGSLASPLEVVAAADSKLAPNSVYISAIRDGAVTTDKIADSAVTPDKISTATYQSGETIIGTWVDGSPIYRQVFSGSVALTANTMATVDTGVDVKKAIAATGYFETWKSGTNANRLVFGQYYGANVYSAVLVQNSQDLKLNFSSSASVSSSDYEVIVDYIK